ncbi:putative Transposase-associated domain-containing protein [Helianthus annuus]|nr:putative Transposase-associated domain-containing protein [Helianthus annuus]
MENVRGWMYLPRRLPEFEAGVIEFLNASFAKAAKGFQILCPCKRCINRYWYRRDEVFDHLKGHGFVEDYYVWVFHGETPSQTRIHTGIDDIGDGMHDNFNELLHDRFRDTVMETSTVQGGSNEDAKKFYKLVEDGRQELFPGCKSFSKLSFIVRLLLYKTLHGLSNLAFDDLLQLLQEMIPEAKLPASFTQARKIIRDLGLDYNKIPACPNDCMLYWKDDEHAEVCRICHTSKWKQPNEHYSEDSKASSKVPAKVVWHFPLKPRLQRLFMCSETAKHMTWHDEGLPKDGNIRHPADGQSWKEFDSLYPNFAKETRNVRLGLSSDGFNPFGTMSSTHSTWPVVLINYNMPPWMSLKPEYFILSLLIPGPESPGYSMLSGWKTKGKFACPCCNYETSSLYLKHSRKTCYMDHRRFLDAQHPWRRNKSAFNGHIEERLSPTPLLGVNALNDLCGFKNLFGKTQKKNNDNTCPWKKSGKSKDHPKARFDILELGIKERLQPVLSDDEKKFSGYKSHDAHIVLHYLLEVAVRKSLPKHVAVPLMRLGAFFRSLCSKDLFNIDGCFFMERYLCKLKSYVRNKSHPEGSIAEGYLIDECLNFCSRYMHGLNASHGKGAENGDDFEEENKLDDPVFVNGGHPLGGEKRRQGKVFTLDVQLREQAHRYALFNSDCAEVDVYINEHEAYIKSQPRQSRWAQAQNHSHDFASWFKDKVINNNVADHIFWLAKGPSPTTKRYHGYYANGYKFYPKSRDVNCKTQNSGVSVIALTPSFASSRDKNPAVGNVDYYGRILDIIELDYWSKFRVVLFHCEWYQVEKDDYGLTCVNLNKLCYSDDPFVMPSQVKQVFYVPDPIVDGLHYVVNTVPRDVYDFDEEHSETDGSTYWCEPNEDMLGSLAQASELETRVSREDIPPLMVDASTELAATTFEHENGDDSDYDDTLWDWMHPDEDDNDN